MKIAICFYGLVGSMEDKNGQGKPLNPEIAFNLNKKNLFQDNDVDIFIHSWSIEQRDTLLALYKPKEWLIEPQVEFNDNEKLLNNTSLYERISMKIKKFSDLQEYKSLEAKKIQEIQRARSRWLSTKKVLELKQQNEKRIGRTYDFVMLLRLDVGFYTKLDFSKLDQKHLYVSNWNDYPNKQNNFNVSKRNNNKGKGFLDFWFLGNSKILDHYATIYDNLNKYHINPHRTAFQIAKLNRIPIKYILYRWMDFEMIRRKEFKALK